MVATVVKGPPTSRPPATENIPLELKVRRAWLPWRFSETPDSKGKFGKIPYNVADKKADYTDPATWRDFDSAVKQYERGAYDGVGLVLGGGLCGLDEDHCVQDGVIDATASAHIERLKSYAEFSISGGIHCLAFGTLPPEGRKCGNHEMYCDSRFFVVTGWHLPGTQRTVAFRERELHEVHEMIFGKSFGTTKAVLEQQENAPSSVPKPSANTQRDREGESIPNISDDLVIKMIRRDSIAGPLWEHGHTPGGDESAEDCAFAQKLAFFSQKNLAQMERIFHLARLAKRDKALRRPDYITRTLRRACEVQGEVWTPPRRDAAREKGKGGRPPSLVDSERIILLRQEGTSLRQIARQCGTTVGTVVRRLTEHEAASHVPKPFQNTCEGRSGGELPTHPTDAPVVRKVNLNDQTASPPKLESLLPGFAIEIWSTAAGRLILVTNESDALKAMRIFCATRGEVYTVAEMRKLNTAPDPASALEMHKWKCHFGGVIRDGNPCALFRPNL